MHMRIVRVSGRLARYRRALSTSADPELALLSQRPVVDLLARCQLTRKTPLIATLAGMKTALPLTSKSWPESSHKHSDSTSLPEGAVFDLVLVGKLRSPSELGQLLEGVAPGGLLAMVVQEASPSQSLLQEVAAKLGHAEVAAALAPQGPRDATTYYEELLGPLCASLDAWHTEYTHTVAGDDAAWRCHDHGTLLRTACTGLKEGEIRALEDECMRRYAKAYPQLDLGHGLRPNGATLVTTRHWFVLAKRPSLVGIYSEYMDYHNHQLEKGWKS